MIAAPVVAGGIVVSIIGFLFIVGAAVALVYIFNKILDPIIANDINSIPLVGGALWGAIQSIANKMTSSVGGWIQSAENAALAPIIRYPMERVVAVVGETVGLLNLIIQMTQTEYDQISTRQTGDENQTNYLWQQTVGMVTATNAAVSAFANATAAHFTGDENQTNYLWQQTLGMVAAANAATSALADATAQRFTGDENAINSYVHQLQGDIAAVGQALTQFEGQTAAHFTGDEVAINTYVRELYQTIDSLRTQLSAQIDSARTQEASDAQRLLSAVGAALTTAEQFAATQVANATTQEQRDIATAEADAQRQALQVAAASASALTQAQAQTAADIATAEARAATAVLGARTYAETIAQTAADAAAAGALGQALPLIQALSGTVTSYLDNCGDPLCEGLLGQAKWGKLFGSALGAGEVLAIIAAVKHDPAGIASELQGIAGGFVRSVAQEIEAL